jgi:hypothetical protein
VTASLEAQKDLLSKYAVLIRLDENSRVSDIVCIHLNCFKLVFNDLVSGYQ